jgi:hypothetical protein
LVPKGLIDDELFLLRLFLALFCLKFSRHVTWREHGQLVHDIIGAYFLERAIEHDSANAMEVYQHRMLVYGSAINRATLSNDRLRTVAGVGANFAVNCGFPNETALCEIGAMEFTRTFDAIESLFSQFRVDGEHR